MTSLKELLAKRELLEAKISEAKTRERTDAIAEVKALMSDYGLTSADIGAKAVFGTKGRMTAPIKYKDQATGEAWSGRGLQPRWLKSALASGTSLDQFKV